MFKTSISYKAYLGFLAALLFYVYEFALRTIFSAAPEPIMRYFHTDAFGLGFMASLFFYGYIPMQIPVGLLFDHIKLKKLFIIANFGCAAAIILFASSQNFIVACVSQFILGIASSFAYVGCLIMARTLWQTKYFAMAVGLIQLMGSLGAMIGGGPVAYSINQIGLSKTLLLFLIICFTSILLFLFSAQDAKSLQYTKKQPHYKVNFKAVVQDTQTRWNALFAFFCWAPIATFGTVWGSAFLSVAYNMHVVKAAATLSLIWLGVAAGGPILGAWSDAIKSRRLPMMSCSVLGLVSILCLVYIPHLHQVSIMLLLITLGFSASVGSVSFGLVHDLHAQHSTATAIGFNNMSIVAGGLILQPLIGWLLTLLDHSLPRSPHSAFYSLASFKWTLMILPFCFLISLWISYKYLKETHCKPRGAC